MKCKRNSDGRAIDHHSLQTMRQQAIKAVGQGESPAQIARVLGINVRSVYRWIAAYASGGQNALLAQPIPGRPAKITEDEIRWLSQTLKDQTPMQFKFDFALWTLGLVGEVIKHQFGKSLALSSLSRLMRIMGFTVQKPLYRAWQQDDRLVKVWMAETYPLIQAQAKAEGAEIYFADESGMRSDHHAGTTWAPQGETPIVSATGRRYSINMLSAINARGHLRFMIHDGTVDASVFKEFLRRLMVGAERPIYLIVDGHPIHKSKLVRDYVESLQGKLTLFFLPPYSPELNPDEQVWGNIKSRVGKTVIQNKEQMRALLTAALRRLQRNPDIVQGFFFHPECRYAI